MKLPGKSIKQNEVDIADYYAVRPSKIWRGFKQEDLAFWWLCICIFFEYVRPQSLYPAIDILPYAQIALLLACFFAFSDRNIKWVSNSGNNLIILFFIVVIFSSVFAFRPSASFDKFHVILNWLILYFLIITVVNTEKKFMLFLLIFFVVNFKMSQFGFRSFLTQGYTSYGVSGAPGWFKDAGDLGIQMLIFVPLSVAFILGLKDYWGRHKKLFFYLLPITGLVTIIATASRGAQLGVVAIGIWLMFRSGKGIKGLVGILLVGFVLYALLPEEMLNEFRVAGEDKTSQARLALWGYGIEVMRDHPLLGVGYYNWLEYCNYMNPSGIADTGRNSCLVPHNSYVTVFAETGVIGFITYMLIMIYIFFENRRTRANAKKVGNRIIWFFAYGLDGGLIAYMVSTFFISVTWYPMIYVQFSLTVALFEISRRQLVDKQYENETFGSNS